jgi:hypothetical protein
MFQIILCVVLFILVYLMFITWILHISPTTSTIDGIAVCTWYKTSGVYMVQDYRCVHGTRHVDTDLRPSVKGHSFSENSHVLTGENNPTHNLWSFICTVKVWMISETRLKSYNCRSYHYLCLHEVSHSQQTTFPDPS